MGKVDKFLLAFGFKKRDKKYKIDKSLLFFGEDEKIRDPDYLSSYKTAPCIICGRVGDVVGAHIRTSTEGSKCGIQKPSDDLTLPLCHYHHIIDQHNTTETKFYDRHKGWTIEQTKDIARERYKVWKNN